MSIISVDTDYDNLAISLTAHFDAPIDRVWELWSDPRKLERWWGPPGYPATFEKHDLSPGGEATYFMTGPEGDKSWGAWRVTAVDPPTSLEFTDAFADADGAPVADSPVSQVRIQLIEGDGGTRMELRMKLESREDFEKLLETGVVEGLKASVSQMDDLL
jgi:uncharacterized protein YndB with AHSA1/START domain